MFLDEGLSGAKFAAGLTGLGYRVELFTNHLPRRTPDQEWVRLVGQKNWLALTLDNHVRQNDFERAAVETFRASLIVLRSQGKKGVDGWVEMLRQAERRLLSTLAQLRRPFIIHVTAGGGVKIAWPPKKT